MSNKTNIGERSEPEVEHYSFIQATKQPRPSEQEQQLNEILEVCKYYARTGEFSADRVLAALSAEYKKGRASVIKENIQKGITGL